MTLTGHASNMLSIRAERCTERLGVRLGHGILTREEPEPINTKAGRS